jgi:hypothetical protein
MCFNEDISLLSYLTGISGSVALFSINKIPESLFYGWVVQMQLIEYFLWKNQPCQIKEDKKICNKEEIQNCNETNKNITSAGIIVNHLEPVILFSSILLFSKKILPLSVIILFCIFLIIIFLYTYNVFKQQDECTTVSEESDPHLHWKWNQAPFSILVYSLFLIILIILSYYGLEDGHINAIMVFIGYISSYMIYKDTHSVGSMWCFMAAFAPWLLYAIYTKK